MTEKKSTKKKQQELKLPNYLRLNKGSMWFDTDGENSSGVKLFSFNKVFVGRGKEEWETQEIIKDKYDNKNLRDYGYIDKSLPWYIDTRKIAKNKLSRILFAYKNKILIEADPENPPLPIKINAGSKEFKKKDNGDRYFVGRNKIIYSKLMNLRFKDLKKFINETPVNETGRNNLLDMLDYERRGHNPLSRPRLEVLDCIREKLRTFGPGMSQIRINEDKD